MAVYAATLLLVLFCSILVDYANKRHKEPVLKINRITSHYFFLIGAIILILVAGLRWEVGADFNTYERSYSVYAETWWESIVNFNEPGIRIIAAVSSFLLDDSATMFFIASAITIGLSVWTLYKYSDYFSISILLYVFIGAWHGSFNGIRQYLACAILFAGHRYIIDRKFWKYFLVVLLASFFHVSALAMILLYFIPIKQLRFKDIIMLLILIILGFSLYDPIFEIANNILINNERSAISLTNSYLNEQVSILRILVMVAPTILYLIMTPDKKLNKSDYFYINMLFVNAAIYIMTMNSAYLARFSIYTNIYVALGFPKVFKGVDKKISALIIFIALILYAMFWGYEILNSPTLNNFQWVFERKS